MLNQLSSCSGVFSVVIGRENPSKNQQHIGFLYQDFNQQTKFLHLAWHRQLKNDIPSPKYFIVDDDFIDIEKVHFAAYCALVYAKNENNISYNFDMDDSYFDDTGQFQKMEEFSGLTCATFVLKIFASQGHHLVDFSTWKPQSKNKEWHLKMLGLLLKYTDTSREFLSKLAIKIKYGISRFKPEEVAAAVALMQTSPNSQKTLELTSKIILSEIISFLKIKAS